MSDNRVVALASAVQLKLSPEATVAAAKVFEAYLAGAAATPAAKPAATTKPAVKKPATKTEEEVVKAALEKQRQEEAEAEAEEGAEEGPAEEPAADDGLPATAEGVQAGIAKLLKANKRKEAINLLKKFNAASASGIKAKDFAKFVAEVNKLLPSDDAASDGEDLTA